MIGPRAIRPDERLAPPESQSPGIHREAAVSQDGLWIGIVRTDPGVGGWHHHSDNDTYVYLLEGRIRVEARDGGGIAEGQAGDFMHVPKEIVHREVTPEGRAATAVIVRIGTGPPVVNVRE